MNFKHGSIAPLLALALAVACGCRSDHDDDHDDDHIGHVIPAHKPGTFPEAVARLRTWLDGASPGSAAVATAEPNAKTDPLTLELDVANWLPELAADGDLPEAQWNEVDRRSKALASAIESLRDGSTAARAEAEAAVKGLEAVLAASDPAWFRVGPASAAKP